MREFLLTVTNRFSGHDCCYAGVLAQREQVLMQRLVAHDGPLVTAPAHVVFDLLCIVGNQAILCTVYFEGFQPGVAGELIEPGR